MKFKEHLTKTKANLKRYEGIYQVLNERFSVNPCVFVWRTRYRAVYLFSKMGLWLQDNPLPGYGETIKKWRDSHVNVGSTVTRNILAIGAQQKYFTRAEIEVAVGNQAKGTAVKSVIRTGVNLGLICEHPGNQYALTELAMEEALDRVFFKLLTPAILEFCEYVVMWNNMRKMAKQIGELEQSGRLGLEVRRTITEEFHRGTYDEEIFGSGR